MLQQCHVTHERYTWRMPHDTCHMTQDIHDTWQIGESPSNKTCTIFWRPRRPSTRTKPALSVSWSLSRTRKRQGCWSGDQGDQSVSEQNSFLFKPIICKNCRPWAAPIHRKKLQQPSAHPLRFIPLAPPENLGRKSKERNGSRKPKFNDLIEKKF